MSSELPHHPRVELPCLRTAPYPSHYLALRAEIKMVMEHCENYKSDTKGKWSSVTSIQQSSTSFLRFACSGQHQKQCSTTPELSSAGPPMFLSDMRQVLNRDLRASETMMLSSHERKTPDVQGLAQRGQVQFHPQKLAIISDSYNAALSPYESSSTGAAGIRMSPENETHNLTAKRADQYSIF